MILSVSRLVKVAVPEASVNFASLNQTSLVLFKLLIFILKEEDCINKKFDYINIDLN